MFFSKIFKASFVRFFDTRKFGWPYTMATAADDIGDGDFAMPNQIWANHIRDIFNQGRNMFDSFLDIYKSMIGTLPPSLNPNVKDDNAPAAPVLTAALKSPVF